MQVHPAHFDSTTGVWCAATASPDVPAPQLRCVTFNVWFDDVAFAPRADAVLELLAGDFNFCASWAAEQAHLDPGYRDLWAALHPGKPGYTEDTTVNTMRL